MVIRLSPLSPHLEVRLILRGVNIWGRLSAVKSLCDVSLVFFIFKSAGRR